MATYTVKSQGVEYTVTIVDKATGGSLVTIDDREFDVKLSGGDTDPVASSRPRRACVEIDLDGFHARRFRSGSDR